MIVRRTTKIGNPNVAAGLKAARVKAGYKSGRAAALAHGWAESTYKAHESATRAISKEDAAAYEKAFGIPDGDLLTAPETLLPPDEGDEAPAGLLDWERQLREQAGLRLRLARYLRGFRTASDAQRHFSAMNRATLAAHEGGANAMSARMAEMYGEAFAVNPHWLTDGRPPSGLGLRVDERLARRPLVFWSTSGVADLIVMVDRGDLALPTRIEALLREIRNAPVRPTGEGQETVFEYSPAAASERRTSGPPKTAGRRIARRWSLPEGLLSKAFGATSTEDVMVVVTDRVSGPFSVGDRLFVDTSKTDLLMPGRYCCIKGSGEMEILEGGTAAVNGLGSSVLLGRVIAAFSRQ